LDPGELITTTTTTRTTTRLTFWDPPSGSKNFPSNGFCPRPSGGKRGKMRERKGESKESEKGKG